ncbi:sigma factor-like helix-turn-helix DNA-binding protein [Nocardia sp. CC227C]|uniref:sigma factor-like helix-turn-helix DNA-binding protein n=1 Tax=Nocardia sp. CC227C TaxID=3044562 RepID=UPI00278BE7CB|nr:sigma factor-like helix-turn-helix DNA-binding protein [Nocardia sp. CC227C]
MARKKSKPVEESLEVQQRRKRALELRLAGKKQYEIAEIMGLHKSTISSYIQDALADVTREKAEEYLELELQRLDAMLAAIWPDIVSGERGAEWKIDRALAIMDQRAKLTGTYKAAELKAIADARGTVSTETSSMVGRFFDLLEKAYDVDEASADAGDDE